MSEAEIQGGQIKVLAVGPAAAVSRTYPDGTTSTLTLDADGWATVIEQLETWLRGDE